MVDLKEMMKKKRKVRVFRGYLHQSKGKVVFFRRKKERRGESESNFLEHYKDFMSKVRSVNEVRVLNKDKFAGKH